jgi:hypothetical protein
MGRNWLRNVQGGCCCCCRRKLLKQRNPRALQVLLGRNTNVVTLQRSEGIRMKEEYHSFRDRTG